MPVSINYCLKKRAAVERQKTTKKEEIYMIALRMERKAALPEDLDGG
jgi:hypothetical protein